MTAYTTQPTSFAHIVGPINYPLFTPRERKEKPFNRSSFSKQPNSAELLPGRQHVCRLGGRYMYYSIQLLYHIPPVIKQNMQSDDRSAIHTKRSTTCGE